MKSRVRVPDLKELLGVPPYDPSMLNLDHKVNGIGTASCGPGILSQHELKPEPFNFTLTMLPYTKDAGSPGELANRLREGK